MPANVLVTGGSGFVGSNLKKIRPDFLYPSRSELDLINRRELYQYITANAVSTIIHLAGDVGGIGYNRGHQGSLMANNLEIGFNVLTVAKELACNTIMVGTTCSFPSTPKTIPFIEDELFDGMPEISNSGYGVAKRTLIKLGIEFSKEFDLKVVNLIPTNMYGRFDNFSDTSSHVIPALIKKFEKEKEIVNVWGDGKATRDFMHVNDFIKALLMSLDKINTLGPDPINLGSGQEVSILELAASIRSAGGYRALPAFSGEAALNGQQRRVLDITRAKERLGWTPTTNFIDGLIDTINWYRSQTQ